MKKKFLLGALVAFYAATLLTCTHPVLLRIGWMGSAHSGYIRKNTPGRVRLTPKIALNAFDWITPTETRL